MKIKNKSNDQVMKSYEKVWLVVGSNEKLWNIMKKSWKLYENK